MIENIHIGGGTRYACTLCKQPIRAQEVVLGHGGWFHPQCKRVADVMHQIDGAGQGPQT